jgi:drug/metabolite transporter (DMT)-like permease
VGLGEAMSPAQILGGILMLAGILMVTLEPAR